MKIPQGLERNVLYYEEIFVELTKQNVDATFYLKIQTWTGIQIDI
jgi:hypothetical protein